jgi:hypothetical protein
VNPGQHSLLRKDPADVTASSDVVTAESVCFDLILYDVTDCNNQTGHCDLSATQHKAKHALG